MYINKETGKLGEDIAVNYLKQNRYTILTIERVKD